MAPRALPLPTPLIDTCLPAQQEQLPKAEGHSGWSLSNEEHSKSRWHIENQAYIKTSQLVLGIQKAMNILRLVLGMEATGIYNINPSRFTTRPDCPDWPD